MDVKSKDIQKFKWGRILMILPFFLFILIEFVEWVNEPELSPLVNFNDGTYILFQHDSDNEYKIIIEGENDQQPVLGTYEEARNGYMRFTPAIPFTEGQVYEVIENGKDYLKFTPFKAIKRTGNKMPMVTGIYPEVDTVPENLLKMYITFSVPVDATQSIHDHITVYDTRSKETRDIFLKLENELWNQDRTAVTLWLDPGRIKKDLIPNKEQGNPIIKFRTYELIVVDNLRDMNGNRIDSMRKKFFVSHRDETKPSVNSWKIHSPAKATKEALKIGFKEALDAMLVLETISIYSSENQIIEGDFQLLDQGKSLQFLPKTTWSSGDYTIKVESRLEDLAGNNLNRLFDVDLEKDVVATKEFYSLSFTIN